ncbi:hypothetical protein ACHAXT_004767 [Thalassiosira profunda]
MMASSPQGALDALAALAAAESSLSTSAAPAARPQEIASSDDDSEAMPPPPPRNPTAPWQPMGLDGGPATTVPGAPSFTFLHDASPHYTVSQPKPTGRMRSASNPEGMEKWDSYSRRNDRLHFVLPSSILEEELASTRRILGEMEDGGDSGAPAPTGAVNGFQQHWNTTGVRRSKRTPVRSVRLGTSPDSVAELGEEEPPAATAKGATKNGNSAAGKARKKAVSIVSSHSPLPDEDGEDESTLEPDELLRRARSRLLEDLSESGGDTAGAAGEKGGSVLTLPHSLSKYKDVYNKNGRIGIYTPSERAAIIQKFQAKRARRVWNKKIRYNCRKNLADRRLRVKGRFVKRTNQTPPPEEPAAEKVDTKVEAKAKATVKAKKTARSSSPPTAGSPLATVTEQEEQPDEDMPDVEDAEAGFEPTEDMPYRRPRRYTIT